jgi:hypothetical protein
MEYNVQEHIKLLKYQQTLKNANKLLKLEDPEKYSKLQNYSLKINDYLHWSKKNDYLQLMTDFLNFKIDAIKFDKEFSEKVEAIEEKSKSLSKNYEELKDIELDLASLEFSKWISEIYLCCNEFYPSFIEEERSELIFAKPEDQLRNAVQDLLLKNII